MPSPFDIRIVANDDSEPGFKKAEKRIEGFAKRAKALGKTTADTAKASSGTFGRATLSFEKATAKLFGSQSMMGKVAERFSGFRQSGATAAQGMQEAATAGSALEGVMGGVGLAAGATVGVLVAAGAAAFKFASDWANSGSMLARLSEGLGRTTQDIQAFQAAGERVNIDSATMTAGLGSFGEALHAAKWGQNNAGLAVMNRGNMRAMFGPDGKEYDQNAMLYQLADLVKAQNNPFTQKQITDALGATSLLPILRRGGAGMKAMLDDARQFAPSLSNGDVAAADRVHDKAVRAWQYGKRLGQNAEGVVGRAAEGPLDTVLAGEHGAKGVVASAGAAAKGFAQSLVDHAIPAIKGFSGALGDLASRIEHLGERSRQNQVSPKGARGVMQVMPSTAHYIAKKHGLAFSENRYEHDAGFSRQLGALYLGDLAKEFHNDQTMMAAAFNAGPGAVERWAKTLGDPRKGQISDADWAERIPYKETRDYVDRVQQPVLTHRHKIEISGASGPTKVTSTTDGVPGVSVGYSMGVGGQ